LYFLVLLLKYWQDPNKDDIGHIHNVIFTLQALPFSAALAYETQGRLGNKTFDLQIGLIVNTIYLFLVLTHFWMR
jgi:uncharacterized membrane protein